MTMAIDQQTEQQVNERQAREIAVRIVEEKRRRMAENGIRYYIPLGEKEINGIPPEHQNDSVGFHQSRARIRAIFGGNRSSKTVTGVCEDVWYATGTHPYKNIPTPNFGRICCTDF